MKITLRLSKDEIVKSKGKIKVDIRFDEKVFLKEERSNTVAEMIASLLTDIQKENECSQYTKSLNWSKDLESTPECCETSPCSAEKGEAINGH